MIDIIIPAYNAHDTIGRTLASIAMQTIVQRVKVLIVDDCSTNGDYQKFVDIFSPLMDIQTIRLEKNGGPAVARQAGMDETDGDFVAFADADDTLVGATALQLLEREMMCGDLDMAGGEFVEELENGLFVKHGENMVWMFAKLYRRNFLDRHLIRFNDTRANEDTGFNTLVQALTRHIKFIPQVVYLWHWRKDSITRENNGVYASSAGHRGYVENMIWSIGEMCDRKLNKEIIREQVVRILCRLYFMHMDIAYTKRMYADDSMEYIRQFYALCYRPIEDVTPSVYLQEIFLNEQMRNKDRIAAVVPVMTLNEFMGEARKEAEQTCR